MKARLILVTLVVMAVVGALLLLAQRADQLTYSTSTTVEPVEKVEPIVPPPIVTPTEEALADTLVRSLVRPESTEAPTVDLAEPAQQIERTGGCAAAVAAVTAVAGIPGGWSISCDQRDTGYRGQADLRTDHITIFWNESQLEYERTVAHELGHAWDNWGLENNWQAEKAQREAWVGHVLTNVEWTSWHSLYAEDYAEHLAASWGWYGAGH